MVTEFTTKCDFQQVIGTMTEGEDIVHVAMEQAGGTTLVTIQT